MRRVLVTGAGGFLGRHLVAALAHQGDEVIALTRDALKEQSAVQWLSGSLFDIDWLTDVCKQRQPTHLVHLAWTATPGLFWNDPANEAWCEMSQQLVSIALASGVRQIVAMGTSAEYAWTGDVCDEASTPITPASRYGQAKARLHRLARPKCQDAGIPLSWLRLFFPYGPGEPPEKFLSSMIRSAWEQKIITLRDPDRKLDLIHVEDVISGILRVLDAEFDDAVNVACGAGVEMRELATLVADGVGRGRVQIVEEAPTQPAPNVVARVERLRSLGWTQDRQLRAGVLAMAKSAYYKKLG